MITMVGCFIGNFKSKFTKHQGQSPDPLLSLLNPLASVSHINLYDPSASDPSLFLHVFIVSSKFFASIYFSHFFL